VLNAASHRGIDFEKEKAGIDKLIIFQKYWITRGLRFAGRKTNRSSPPLAEFVRGIAVPTLDTVRGVVVFRDFPWIPYEKKLTGRNE